MCSIVMSLAGVVTGEVAGMILSMAWVGLGLMIT
jgi:hypothetical protein